jgi:threonine synthase
MWRYRELLPILDDQNIISMGEGWTPLIKFRELAKRLGTKSLFMKIDYAMPTFSFKDRGTSCVVSRALELGLKRIAIVSSGNAGASLAAYCARAGLGCLILVPDFTPAEKLAQITVYGPKLAKITATVDQARDFLQKSNVDLGITPMNTSFLRAYYKEGMKTLAFEICEQFDWDPPEWVLIPSGSGSSLLGAWKGFNEFKKLGLIERYPKLVAVESQAAQPIAEKLGTGAPQVSKTVATALLVREPPELEYVVAAIKESGGTAVVVEEERMLQAQKGVAKSEGVFAEPSGAIAIGAVANLVDRGFVDRDERIVCVAGGAGLKDLKSARLGVPEPLTIGTTLEEIRSIIHQQKCA